MTPPFQTVFFVLCSTQARSATRSRTLCSGSSAVFSFIFLMRCKIVLRCTASAPAQRIGLQSSSESAAAVSAISRPAPSADEMSRVRLLRAAPSRFEKSHSNMKSSMNRHSPLSPMPPRLE